MAYSSGKWPEGHGASWREIWCADEQTAYGRGPTHKEIDEAIRKILQIRQEREPNYPPYFMQPALELAYATLTPDEKKEVMRIAREECGTFYNVDIALQVVPIFQKHIQAVLEKSKGGPKGS